MRRMRRRRRARSVDPPRDHSRSPHGRTSEKPVDPRFNRARGRGQEEDGEGGSAISSARSLGGSRGRNLQIDIWRVAAPRRGGAGEGAVTASAGNPDASSWMSGESGDSNQLMLSNMGLRLRDYSGRAEGGERESFLDRIENAFAGEGEGGTRRNPWNFWRRRNHASERCAGTSCFVATTTCRRRLLPRCHTGWFIVDRLLLSADSRALSASFSIAYTRGDLTYKDR